MKRDKFMFLEFSLNKYLAELELRSFLFVVGGVVTVGIATAYWWYTLFKDRD
jgi:hypothetical protein